MEIYRRYLFFPKYTIPYIVFIYSYKIEDPMPTKAERTTAFIIETVAPLFNKHGYIGTSMSDLTEATGLTKGAIYGNFENKESLALAAFEYSSNKLLQILEDRLNVPGNALDKLASLTDFYKNYDQLTEELGGCPVLNIGVDAQNNNSQLAAAAHEVAKTIEGKIALVLENGVNQKEIKLPVPPLLFAKQLYTMLQGAIAMATISGDRKYLLNTVAYLEVLINREIKH